MIRAEEYPVKDEKEKLAVSYFITLTNKDWDSFSALFTDDIDWVMPFAPDVPGLAPSFHGREQVTEIHRAAGPARLNYVWNIESLNRTQDPDRIIIEATAHSHNPATGLDYDQIYIFVYQLRGNEIAHMKIYCDPRSYENSFKDADSPYG